MLKHGWAYGDKTGKEYPCAANQYFYRRGGHFVYADGAGNMTLVASSTSKIFGWAETPKDAAGYNSWKSSATAKGDSVFVVTNGDAVYAIPALETTASLNASCVGDAVDIITSGSTYTMIQYANIGVNQASPQAVIEAVDVKNKLAYVRINAFQADT